MARVVKNANKKRKKKNKSMKMRFKDRHPVASVTLKVILVLIFLAVVIGLGILAGIFFGAFGNELKISKESLVVGYENSTVYDADGNLLATLSGGTKRKSVKLSEMSEYLPKAYVAIEDERFYKHSGVDVQRTLYATLTYITNGGKSSFGGSTITQQVIKNITQEKDNSSMAGVKRKVKEISKAIQVEKYLSKDQILELYLNLIFTAGNDINGVELGSIYYFNKKAKDLSIAECAYMAGINNSPNAYKPFEDYSGDPEAEKKKAAMSEKIKTRTKTVLGKMKELGFITDDQYTSSCAEVENGLAFSNGEESKVTTTVSYHTEAAINQILNQIMNANPDMNRDMAEMYLYSSGFKIYTTQKSNIQKIVEDEIVKPAYITSTTVYKTNEAGEKVKETQYSVPTIVVEDYRTGQVVACASAVGSKEERNTLTKLGYFNYPTEIKKQTGSSMKPISVIGPGLESGTITGATVYDDCPTTWGTGASAWSPKEWYSGYKGLMNMRTAIKVSANIPHAKALTNIGTEYSVEFCKKVGLPDFTKEGISLSLGGLHDGISPAELCGAYSAIANDGKYITQTFYTKVEDISGNVVYEPKKVENQAMSPQNAYIEKDILKEPTLAGGTATYCVINGMDVAAKTGTTNDDYDRWLAGFTPYYAAACWYGYVQNAEVDYSGNPAGKIWDAVMTEIHKDLPGAKFEEPEGIIRKTVCNVSGLLAGSSCGSNVHTELFTESNVPTKTCEGHSSVAVCNDSGLLATTSCPNVSHVYTTLPEKEIDAPWTSRHSISGGATIPVATCNIHAMGVTAAEQAAWQAATDRDAAIARGDAAAAAEAQARFQAADAQIQAQKAGLPVVPQTQTTTTTTTTTTPTQHQTPSQVESTPEASSTAQTPNTPSPEPNHADTSQSGEKPDTPPGGEQGAANSGN